MSKLIYGPLGCEVSDIKTKNKLTSNDAHRLENNDNQNIY